MSHADLIEKLEKLTGPVPDAFERGALAKLAPDVVYDLDSDNLFNLILIGGQRSIGAAVALVERVLPGAYGSVQFGTEPCQASVLKDQTTVLPSGHYKVSTECSARASAATSAIALLIATLKALQENSNG